MGQNVAPDPDPPAYDWLTDYLLHAYHMISRARRYAEVQPLPLSIADINAYCEAHPPVIERESFDDVIITLDDWLLSYLRDR